MFSQCFDNPSVTAAPCHLPFLKEGEVFVCVGPLVQRGLFLRKQKLGDCLCIFIGNNPSVSYAGTTPGLAQQVLHRGGY